MKYLLLSLLLWGYNAGAQVVDTTKILRFTEGKCDGIYHDYTWVAATYPPCFDCHCGKHLRFDMKTYMALEIKYGDSLYKEVRRFMKSGSWHRKEDILDSATIEKLAGVQYEKVQKQFREMFRRADSIENTRNK